MSSIISANQLCLTLDQQPIVKSLSFTISEGQFVGIIGPNGAGKSSLVKLLRRELTPSSGSISLRGHALSTYNSAQLARLIAVVDQHPSPLFDLTVWQVVAMGLLPHKRWFQTDSEADRQQIVDALNAVGVAKLAKQLFQSLSGGEQQRSLIARALVQQPSILLMDEPTNHLDVRYQHQVLALAKQLGITVLTTIHDLNLAASYCDHLLLLDQGQLFASGSPEQVLTSENLTAVFGLACHIDCNPFDGRPRVTFTPAPTAAYSVANAQSPADQPTPSEFAHAN